MIILTIIIIALPLILLIALFTKKGFVVTHEVEIDQSVNAIFDYVRMLGNQEHYHQQAMIDAGMKKQFSGTDGTTGFVYAWESKNPRVGKVSQILIEVTSPNKLVSEVLFEKPFHSKAKMVMELSPVTDKTTHIQWTFIGNEHPYYLLRVGHLLFMVKKAVSTDMKKSLLNLKAILEN